MNGAWASSFERIWHSPAFPMWLALAAACFFGLFLLIIVARAEKSVANGALVVITLLAIGVGVAGALRVYGPMRKGSPNETGGKPVMTAALPALSCIDDLAGDTVLTACEKTLFSSPDSIAAAVSYAAAQMTRLGALADSAAIDKNVTPELKSLRRAMERDRYGVVAQALVTRDNCTPGDCAAFHLLTDHRRVAANMEARAFDDLVTRYMPSWNMASTATATGPLAAMPGSVPTGRPTNAEFPSATSTPAVSIMTSEPSNAGGAVAPTRQVFPATATTTTSAPRPAAASAHAAAPAPKKPKAHPPVQIAPAADN